MGDWQNDCQLSDLPLTTPVDFHLFYNIYVINSALGQRQPQTCLLNFEPNCYILTNEVRTKARG